MRLTPERVAKALTKSGAMISETAAMLNVTPQTVYNFLKRHPELQQLRNEIEEQMLDRAEADIATAIMNGDLDACMFYLDRRGKNHGLPPAWRS